MNSKSRAIFMFVLLCLFICGCGGKSTAKSLKDSFNEGYGASGQKVENSPLYSKTEASQKSTSKSSVKYNEKKSSLKQKPKSKQVINTIIGLNNPAT